MDDNLWGSLAIDTDLLPETYIHTADSSVPSKCIAAHTHIANEVAVGSTGPVSPTSYAAKAIGIMQDSDITPMDVKMGAELVHAHLTAGANVDPYKFMVNLFVATSIKDGVQGSSMQVWADKMVFEASRKKVFEAAAEKSMFMKIYIPTITAIEMFSFFIAPVMMVLSVAGSGSGFDFSPSDLPSAALIAAIAASRDETCAALEAVSVTPAVDVSMSWLRLVCLNPSVAAWLVPL